jgi:opacity protein-like surface antigen
MKNLFKVVLVLFVVFAFSETNAQISAGAGVHYGTDISNIGFSINGKYQINDTWSAAPSFTLFLKKDYVTWSALDLDANYKITEIEKVGSLYGLAGLNMTFYKIKFEYDLGEWGGSYSETATGTEVGINLGLGIDIPLGDKLTLAPEVRYSLGGANYLRMGAKVMYAF